MKTPSHFSFLHCLILCVFKRGIIGRTQIQHRINVYNVRFFIAPTYNEYASMHYLLIKAQAIHSSQDFIFQRATVSQAALIARNAIAILNGHQKKCSTQKTLSLISVQSIQCRLRLTHTHTKQKCYLSSKMKYDLILLLIHMHTP